jgi:hypothetical protein
LSRIEIPVGVSPAARPAAVVRSRRDSFPIAVRSRVAVSMSNGGAVVAMVSLAFLCRQYLLAGKH